MPIYGLLVAYDGSGFHGFARQGGPQAQLPTVQGSLEKALAAVLRTDIVTTGAGRTDAGVHALGQVVSFSVPEPIDDLPALQRRLNALCGPEIACLEVEQAPDGFDARFSALSRSYEYAIFTREVHDPFSRHVAWHHPGQLDAEAMHAAAQALVGSHDFSSFGRLPRATPEPPSGPPSPIREVWSIAVERQDDLVLIRVTANAFLQQMVRSIVGTLVKVGEGVRPVSWVAEVLAARDRSAAGPVAPPQGLFLMEVAYPEDPEDPEGTGATTPPAPG
ncbi:MAG TPA: tRNA pseudouridine(38-40) synthase TruA [Actinomycetota bacterium]|nr:tRNA pseudouridine(38-40) synthase TruA [Actinomycetota bacterium]